MTSFRYQENAVLYFPQVFQKIKQTFWVHGKGGCHNLEWVNNNGERPYETQFAEETAQEIRR